MYPIVAFNERIPQVVDAKLLQAFQRSILKIQIVGVPTGNNNVILAKGDTASGAQPDHVVWQHRRTSPLPHVVFRSFCQLGFVFKEDLRGAGIKLLHRHQLWSSTVSIMYTA